MPSITFIEHDGTSHLVHTGAGSSVMQAAVDNDITAIVAECGGACSCATCHCYIDDAWFSRLEEPSDIECDMLECALEPAPNSRLSCQVEVTDELDGIVVRLPESQF